MKKALLTVALSAFLASCAGTGGLKPQASGTPPDTLEASRSFEGIALADAAWPSADWWTRFNDPQLDALVDEALKGSPTLRAADARVRKALAAAGIANAARLPQMTGNASVTRERLPEKGLFPPPLGGSWITQGDLSTNLSYDLDLWGRNRSAYESALDEAHASSVDRYAAQLFLSTSIVRAYVQLQRAYDQLDVAQALVADRERVRALTEQRTANGIDSRVELRQAEAALPEARERVIRLEETIALTRNQIAALLGAGPDRGLQIERPRMRSIGALALPSALPADLIGRRPDVVASRWRVEAARKDIAVAKAEFYPNVNVVAFLGLQAIGLGNLLHAGSTMAGVTPALRLPIFEGGRLRANLAGRNADYDAAVERYNQSLADALREVVDQLASMKSVDAQRREANQGLKTAQGAYDLALLRYKEGLGNYLQVLNAESQVLGQKSLQADLDARELDIAVNLTRALGGGYQDKDNAPIVGALK
ncbi:MAG TPA: efflux transporter outer membrane subunit [Burkholderiales bacterium]|nr:efflux transporter outer membrane subunit [Burkholderiales bacterium]